jgi:putative oxygen-independent coproporphyrinogen III oxidase
MTTMTSASAADGSPTSGDRLDSPRPEDASGCEHGGVPSTLPDGEPAPHDGSLPDTALAEFRAHSDVAAPFGVYVHVPFCATRCGYCDFNTYTATELGPGVTQATYAAQVVDELRLARRVLGDVERPVATVFFGGGTPTLLPSHDLVTVLRAIDDLFGLAPDVEVTTEANPDSVTPRSLAELRAAGFTRVSLGMQSAVPHVLATLDRTHRTANVAASVAAARGAGFGHVSLDLIYGTAGESADDWQTSLQAALSVQPDHVSAYALVVEDGTRLAGQVRRGEVAAPDDDDLADKYVQADAALSHAGMSWYEVSNWSLGTDARCRHNLGYWRGDDWWGVGPGAHSHVGGVRWWNVKHPAAYAERLAAGRSPAHAREVLDDGQRAAERTLLGIRLAEGLPVDAVSVSPSAVTQLVDDGLLDGEARSRGRLRLTLRGRLLADAVVRALLP